VTAAKKKMPENEHTREWWTIESRRLHTDWRGVVELHLAIIDRLRSSS
jgi:hypothetical protein